MSCFSLVRPQTSCAGRAAVPTARLPTGSRAASRRVQLKAAQTLAAVETTSDKKKELEAAVEGEEEQYEMPGLSPQQVGSFLSVLCEETEIAEVELKLDGFSMTVRRKVEAPAATIAVAAAAPVAAEPAPVAPSTLSSAPMASATLDEDDIRESLVDVISPKVGTMRTARYVKGKKVGKGPLVSLGDKVKKGQVIYFVEQLGTHVPVEVPQAGEVVELFKEDGDPVEYGEIVAEISPFFGGHIIGEAKYA